MSPVTSDALFLDRDLRIEYGSRQVADPASGQARLRLEWAGVCGSDLHVLRSGDWVSYWPAILGHEVVGVIEACPGAELAVGTRVVVDSRVACGGCAGCDESPIYCVGLRWLGEAMPGGYQRYGNFDVSTLYPCPESLDSSVAVLAEPLAVAMHAVGLISVIPGRVLLLGYGPVGALIHMELRRIRPLVHVDVREPNIERLQMALAAGARIECEPVGTSWPLVVDAAGFPGSLNACVQAVATNGDVLLVAIAHSLGEVNAAEITEKAMRITGSHGFTTELPRAIELLDRDPATYRWLITEAVLLEEAAQRLTELTTQGASGKVVIRL